MYPEQEYSQQNGLMQSGGRPMADAWLQPVTMEQYRSGKRRDIIKNAVGSHITISITANMPSFRRTSPVWVSHSLFCLYCFVTSMLIQIFFRCASLNMQGAGGISFYTQIQIFKRR